MILSFTIENWMSYRDKASFSMVASRERQHGGRVAKLAKYQTRILPIAAVYGGNASGKTNFFKALNFVKTMVVRGNAPDSPIAVETFRLDAAYAHKPTIFTLEILVEETIYELSFAVNQREVLEEKLVRISSTAETVLYRRSAGHMEWDSSFEHNQFLKFAFQGTRDNQLFLTNSISQKVEIFRPVYDWFKNNLELIAPDSRFESFEHFLDEEHPLYGTMNDMLPQLDTGIAHLGSELIAFENTPFAQNFKTRLQQELAEGMTVRYHNVPTNERFIISRKSGELIVKKLVSFHKSPDGSETKFEIRQESDGSQRVIDLLPAFLEISASNSTKVYVIDELDRSLHSLLTRQLLEVYLSNCGKQSRAQLLITTHDVLLMDQALLRRDEMWVAERQQHGGSGLISFSDYKDVRYDKDLRKSYLQGRLGGIPRILLNGSYYQPEE